MGRVVPKGSNEIISEIINVDRQKNILISHQNDLNTPDVLFVLLSEVLTNFKLPLILVCLMEPSSTVENKLKVFDCNCDRILSIDTVSTITKDEHTVIHSKKNYSGILIDIKKFIQNEKHVLVLDSLDALGSEGDEGVFIKFLSSLINVSKDSKGIVLTSISEDFHEPKTQKMLSSLFGMVLHVNSERIQIESEIGRKDVFYEIHNGKLILNTLPKADISEIQAGFNFTLEEITQLDEVVEKKAAIFANIMS